MYVVPKGMERNDRQIDKLELVALHYSYVYKNDIDMTDIYATYVK